jgi:hypothetical protein
MTLKLFRFYERLKGITVLGQGSGCERYVTPYNLIISCNMAIRQGHLVRMLVTIRDSSTCRRIGRVFIGNILRERPPLRADANLTGDTSLFVIASCYRRRFAGRFLDFDVGD